MAIARWTTGRVLLAVVSAGCAAALPLSAIRPLSAAQTSFGITDDSAAPEPRLDSIVCARRSVAANEVAVLDFKGDMTAHFDGDAVYATLNRIAGNPRIAAVVLRIESSGGDSYTAKKLHEAVRKARVTCRLPMAAFIGSVGTSGAFWLAMAADEVHADPLSTIGGIGVLATYVNEREKLEKEGIRHTVIRTGERKWPLMPYLPVDGADVQKVKDSLDIVLAEFVAAVETARQGKLKLTRDQLTTGEAWMGRDGVALGLVDPSEEIDAVAARLIGGRPAAYRMFDLVPPSASRKKQPPSEEQSIASAERHR